jgi:hypothetical protein
MMTGSQYCYVFINKRQYIKMVFQKNWGSQPSGITFSCKPGPKDLIPTL